jgi:phosphoribosylformylglycinamidine cyclo-ligase
MLFKHKIFLSDTPELLNPTIIYAPVVASLLKDFPIMGMAHITGGGIPGNLPRCLPEGLKVDVDYNAWPMPKLFSKIMLAGEIPEEEMKKTFNMGIGYCVVVPANVATDVQQRIYGHQLNSWIIGEVTHI